MNPEQIENIYELSPAQQGMLFQTLSTERSGMHFEQVCLELHGDLDLDHWRGAWQRVIERHPALRSSFHIEDLDKPLQIVHRSVEPAWRIEDWSAIPPFQRHTNLLALLATDRAAGFDPAEAPLMRMALLRYDDTSHTFVWSHHHLLLDGWSLPVVLTEVFRAYAALRQNQPLAWQPARPYSDYIDWLQRYDSSDAQQFWAEWLAGFSAPTPLPRDPLLEHHTVAGSDDYGEQQVLLPAGLTSLLRGLAQRGRVTLSTVVQGAWALLLARYSAADDIVFGVTVAGRPAELEGIETAVGLFINTLPLRLQVAPEQPVLAWLQYVQRRVFALRDYEHTPMNQVLEWGGLPHALTLFESILVFENYPVDQALRALEGDLSVREIEVIGGKTDFPLAVQIDPGTNLMLRANFDRHRLSPTLVAQMLDQFERLLAELAAAPERPVGQLAALQRPALLVQASFAAGPLEEPLRFWSQALDLPLRLSLDGWPAQPSAASGADALVVLVRAEDLAGDPPAAAAELIAALRAQTAADGLRLLCVCPSSPEALSTPERAALLAQAEHILLAADVPGLLVRGPSDLAGLHPEPLYDPAASGTAPHYSAQALVTLATLIIEALLAGMPNRDQSAEARTRAQRFQAIRTELPDAGQLLAAIERSRSQGNATREFVAPRTPIERMLADIWQDLLGVEQVSIHDTFFDLGGYSLLAMQIVARVRATFLVDIPLKVLFMGRLTVAKLAEAVESYLLMQADEADLDQELADLSALSDDEVRALLGQA
ncbi:MAG: hypothetical protein OHK0022_49630 [Roseiflexaceae bacterium]